MAVGGRNRKVAEAYARNGGKRLFCISFSFVHISRERKRKCLI